MHTVYLHLFQTVSAHFKDIFRVTTVSPHQMTRFSPSYYHYYYLIFSISYLSNFIFIYSFSKPPKLSTKHSPPPTFFTIIFFYCITSLFFHLLYTLFFTTITLHPPLPTTTAVFSPPPPYSPLHAPFSTITLSTHTSKIFPSPKVSLNLTLSSPPQASPPPPQLFHLHHHYVGVSRGVGPLRGVGTVV